VPREELWITDKVNTGPWSGDGPVTTRAGSLASVQASLQKLGTDYIDLMLIHGTWVLNADEQLAVWRGLIDAKSKGYVRAIGVSNFNRQEIEALEAATGVLPTVNQVEFHPWVPDATVELVRWCQKRNIAVTAYGSLGGSANKAGEVEPSQSSNVATVAVTHGCSNAQVLLRWALNQGVAVIPGATSAAHIQENLRVPSFQLTASDRKLLAGAKPAAFKRWRNLSEEIACRAGETGTKCV
jgi:2,5-diketo-D-gluconate reductase A